MRADGAGEGQDIVHLEVLVYLIHSQPPALEVSVIQG